MTEPKKRLIEFEALRGLSIVLLLTLHSEIIGASAFGVSLDPLAKFVGAFLLGSFFFLAGYFIDYSLQKSREDMFGFVKSRFIRIFPPYWLSMVFFIKLFTLKRIDLIVYLLNLQAVFSPEFVKPLLTLWYISMLVVYYIIFGILLWRIRSNKTLLFVSAGIFALVYVVHLTSGLFDVRFFRYYFVFLAGVYFYRFEDVRKYLLNIPLLYCIIVSILSSWLFWLVQINELPMTNGIYLLVVDFFILSWVLTWLSIFRLPIGSWKIWALLSTASYFAYLFHRPLWYVLQLVFDVNDWGGEAMFNFTIGSIVTLVVGYFMQYAYDHLLAKLHLKG